MKQLIKDWCIVAVSVLVIGLAVFYTGNSRAADMDDLIASVTVSTSMGADGYDPETGYRVTAGWDNVYLWGSSQEHDVRILGQGVSDKTVITGVGLGVTEQWGKWSVFLEGGWGMIDYTESSFGVVDEVSYTYLVNRHHNEGRQIPFNQCYNHKDCNRGYALEFDDAFVGRIGVEYEIINHIGVSMSYRYMRSSQYIAAWDWDRYNAEPHQGYWEERINYDFSAVELGVSLKW